MKNTKIAASRIVMLSGSPGTGKSTISQMLATNAASDKSVHIEVDDFWQSICKGYIHPWLDDSGNQNETVVEAVVASVKSFSAGGYEVFVAGTIGPWFLEPWMEIAKTGIDVRYIVLRPDQETTIKRATHRPQREFFPLNTDAVKNVWDSFTNLGRYEAHVLDTTGQSASESVAIVNAMLLEHKFRL